MLKSDIENRQNVKNWCSLVRNLLCELGFYDAWLAQSVGNVNMFLSLAKQRLKDHFIQNWSSRLEISSRALFYNNIKCFELQPYYRIINIKKFRVCLTQLRVSSHRLQIEAGRWNKPESIPLNERKCNFCNKIEDEYHFMLECILYRELRVKFIPRYYRMHPNMFKLIELFKSNDVSIVKNLSVYIYKAFEIRKNNVNL